MKPTYFLLMWKGGCSVSWCELNIDEWVNVDQNPKEYQIFVINGMRAKVMIATWEKGLNYSDALKTAISFVSGAYNKITVDLKELTGTIEKGVPHGIDVHPHY